MTFLEWVAALSPAVGLVGFLFVAVAGVPRGFWVVPALAFVAFTAWTAVALVREGPIGFWTNHTQNMLGIQVWVDLILALLIGWALIVPQARALKMSVFPWLVFIGLTGSIGFLAMLSRFLYLRDRAA